MRLLLDLQGAQTASRFRGIGRYSLALAQAIARNVRQHEVWICLNASFPETLSPLRAAFHGLVPPERILTFAVPRKVAGCETVDDWRRRAAELIREAFIDELRPDIVHVSSLFEGSRDSAVLSVGRLADRTRTAVTLYDLIPLLNEDTYLGTEEVKRWYREKLDSLKRADLLLAISEYARQEAIGAGVNPAASVVSISSACADIFKPLDLHPSNREALMQRLGIRLPFLMYSGAFDSRKNLYRLLEGFSKLPPTLQAGHELVLVGPVAEAERIRLESTAESLGIRGRVIFTGHVSDDDLLALLRSADLFVFPSLHEGFGLPVLEAMACGTPTIGSNRTSIPEVIGLEEALFDPTDAVSIANKIAEVLTSKDLQQKLRQHGIDQSRNFSWDQTAERAIAAFESIVMAQPMVARRSWREEAAHRQSSYPWLIEALVAIPHVDGSPSDVDLAEAATCIASNREVTERVARAQRLPDRLAWRIEGPFDSSYSLALLNRETARALSELGHHVVLHSTEGPGDFDPSPEFLRVNEDLARMYVQARDVAPSDANVTSRNLYPPRVQDMECQLNLLHHFAWEETGFPQAWAQSFNEHLQGVTCLSQHVAKLMVDHGVSVPLSVSGCGVDHWERIEADQDYRLSARAFRFLHVSSCFPRKGADILLKAYGMAFRSDEDVSLVIKTFRNPHNDIHRWLREAQADVPDFPHVVIIEDDLSDAELKALYLQCSALVAPSRAEGFGLPMAEAMLSGMAVITTGWSGQLDFCNSQSAWLIDYEFEPAHSHLNVFDSVWAAPNVDHLARTMREVHGLTADERTGRSARGRDLLLAHFKWQHVAERLVEAARECATLKPSPELRIGWISTYNTRCGIATYSAHLIEQLPAEVVVFAARTTLLTEADTSNVVRCWNAGDEDSLDDLRAAVEQHNVNALVVQFNYGFFNLDALCRFLQEQLNARRVVVAVLHATNDPVHAPHKRLVSLMPVLQRCDRVLVHSVADLNRLKYLEVVDNAALFPHGIRETPAGLTTARPAAGSKDAITIASYGFFLPHKGLLELIDAFALLRKRGLRVRLRMVNAEYPVDYSAALIAEAKRRILELDLANDVDLYTDFLSDEASLRLLSEADLLVFPYQETGESSSAAVRYGLAASVPVAVTPLAIFDNVASVVSVLPGFTPSAIAAGINELLQGVVNVPETRAQRSKAAAAWREAYSHSLLARRLYGMLTGLLRQRRHQTGFESHADTA